MGKTAQEHDGVTHSDTRGVVAAAPSSLPAAKAARLHSGEDAAPSAHKRHTAAASPVPASPARRADIAAIFALATAMLLWSGTFIAMKLALVHFHPVFMVFIRMTASTMLLVPFYRGWARRSRYTPGDWRLIALMVLAEPCMYFMFEA